MDIYESIDNILGQIRELEKSKAKQETEFEKKTKEMIDICYRYSESAYRLLGEIDRSHLDDAEKVAMDRFKNAIDSCIIADRRYKEYLECRYIKKDFSSFENSSEKWAEYLNGEGLTDYYLSDTAKEDDTDTLNIIEDK